MPFLAPVAAAIFGGGFVTQLLVGTALTIGGTLLSQAMAPKPEGQKDPGVSLSMRIGGDNPLSFFVGTAATGGHRVYAGTWGTDGGTPNAYFVDVLELSNAPLDGLNAVYVDGERATVRWNQPHAQYGYPINQGRKKNKDHLWVKFYDGRQTAADPYLRARFGGLAERPYEADMVGRGNGYAVVTTRYNRDLWKSGAPKMLFEVRGLRLYDIRKDSSAGGVGAHRRNNPATWEFSENPYVIAYNVAFMGVYVCSEWLWGLQNLPPLRLPTSAWVAAMNEADRILATWGNQRQFTIGGEITVDMEPAAVLEEIAKSSMGRFIESAGSYKPRCGASGTSVWNFGEADLLITDPRTITPFPGLESTHNTVEATYAEPGEAWGTKAAPVQSNAAYIAADGNRRLAAGLSFPLVSRNEQVQRLAYSYLEDGRRFRQFRASFHPITWLLEPGDVIDGTILSEGYEGKQFEILEMSGRRTFVQTMTLREIDPADFDSPASARQDWSVGPIQTIYPPAQVVTGWAVSPYEYLDTQSRARRPGIQCFYAGAMDDIRAIEIMIRRPEEADPFFSQEYPYDADNLTPSVVIVGDFILPGESYEVASIFVPYSGRDMEVSDWIPVTTPDIRLGPLDVQIDEIAAEVQEAVGELSDWATHNTRETIERLREAFLEDGAGSAKAYLDRQRVRTELIAVAGQVRAEYTRDILAAVGPDSAIVARIEELRAEVFDPESGLPATASALSLLSSLVNDPGTGLAATSNAITSLLSSVPGASAEGLLRIFTEAAPSGANARVALSVAASAGASASSAALYLDAMSNGTSEAILVGGRVSLVAGPSGAKQNLLVVDGNAVWIDNARIRNLTIDNMDAGFIDAIEVDAETILSQNANITGTLHVGTGSTGIFIQGPNNRILMVDNT